MEKLPQELPGTSPSVREVRTPGNGRGSRRTCVAGRSVLERQIPKPLYVMPQPQVSTRTTWYTDVNWTYGDYFDELTYITYDFE